MLMQNRLVVRGVLIGLLVLAAMSDAQERTVLQSARQIPVAFEVDVVVAGGSTGAVAAAVAAAEQGAKVFLAAPQPYLGEDVCGTYRLWLEPDETPATPLAQAMFAEPPAWTPIQTPLPFTYETSIPSHELHKDTTPPSLLADGNWQNAFNHSVQYNGDVVITADLGEIREIGRIHVLAFQRNGDIELQDALIATSADGGSWHEAGAIKNDRLGQGAYVDSALVLSMPLEATARYVRVIARKTPNVERLLLGEIVLEAPVNEDEALPGRRLPPTPMQVKRSLDQALLNAGVQFLYGCYPTDILRNPDGEPAGIVMANRSGRQAVLARVIIDASDRGTVARMAGAKFTEYPAGSHPFTRIVVGGEAPADTPARVEPLPSPVQNVQAAGGTAMHYEAFAYTLDIAMPDASWASFARAENTLRDASYARGQVAASDLPFQIPPERLLGRSSLDGDWPGADAVDVNVFRPADINRLYVLGGCADLPRDAAARLLRPLAYMDAGTRVGRAAAGEALRLSASDAPSSRILIPPVYVPGNTDTASEPGDVRESLAGLRPFQDGLPAIPAEAAALPVLGEYDVLVIGGGTGGAPAGISAARQGAKTLVVEYLHGLGGVSTLGLIGNYYWGHRQGFTAEIDAAMEALGAKKGSAGWDVEARMEWYRRELRAAGADLWFGCIGCGAVVEGSTVKGVVVATPFGRGVVLANVVIDSTGNADIAVAAGAQSVYTDGSHVAVQGTGMPPRNLGAHYTNTDYTLTDDGDLFDTWRTFVVAKGKYETAFDLAQIVDSRERRRVVGDFVISPLDLFNGRTYPDSIGYSHSNFDSHGFTVHPLFTLNPPHKQGVGGYTPYRALLPRGYDGMLVTGLGISAHRDAIPILRMQPDVQNQGYAAGAAAAMAAKSGSPLRDIDIKALQRHLVDTGCVPENVLTDTDSYPFTEGEMRNAVANVVNDFDGLGVILAQADEARPFLRSAYELAANPDNRLVYAHILGMLGDAMGITTLLEAIDGHDWDEGWNFTGMGQYGNSVSYVDSLIIAAGSSGDRRALEPVLRKLGALDAESEFSHHRAVAIALESLKAPEAAEPLARLLQMPEMTGYAATTIERAQSEVLIADPNLSRTLSLRELILARALFRCGDHEGLGERILRTYAQDLRGHYARHAHAVLNE
jgi:hypothetical protein